MRIIMTAGAIATLAMLGACRDAGENKVEVERPTIGTTKDTLKLPEINMPDSVVLPTLEVGRDTVPVGGTRRDTVPARRNP